MPSHGPHPTWTRIRACAAGPSSRAFHAPDSRSVRARSKRSACISPRDWGCRGGSPQDRSLTVPAPVLYTLAPWVRSTKTDTTRRRKCARRTAFPRVPLVLELHFPKGTAACLAGLTGWGFHALCRCLEVRGSEMWSATRVADQNVCF